MERVISRTCLLFQRGRIHCDNALVSIKEVIDDVVVAAGDSFDTQPVISNNNNNNNKVIGSK